MLFRTTVALILAGLAWTPLAAQAQPDAQDAADASEAINAVYDRMAAAYDTLDLDALAGLYTEDAVYLTPDDDEALMRGREAVRDHFGDFFARVQAGGDQIAITFRIVQREVAGDVAYDAGYYKVDYTRADGSSGASTGKFTTVLRRAEDGTWRFAVDAFGDAPPAAFDLAEPIR